MKVKILLFLLFGAGAIFIYYSTSIKTSHEAADYRVIDLWAEGRYKVDSDIVESGHLLADILIDDYRQIQDNFVIAFELTEAYQYFIVTLYRETPEVFASEMAFVPSLFIQLFNGETGVGETFSMNIFMEEGTTYIIYAASPWPVGTHLINLHYGEVSAPDNTLDNVHVQIIAGDSVETLSKGLMPPELRGILTMEAITNSVTALGADFIITNHSPFNIWYNMNYTVEEKLNGKWEPVSGVGARGHSNWGFIDVLSIFLEPGEYFYHHVNWEAELGALRAGEYRIKIPRMIWQWANDEGVVLRQTIPFVVEFVIE